MYEETISKYVVYDAKTKAVFARDLSEQNPGMQEAKFYNTRELFFDVAKKVRANVVMGVDLEKNRTILFALADRYNQFRTSEGAHTAKPTPKTPGCPAQGLYGSAKHKDFNIIEPNINLYTNDVSDFGSILYIKWIEDYFETFVKSNYIASKLAVELSNDFDAVKAAETELGKCRASRGLGEIKNSKGKSMFELLNGKGMQILKGGSFALTGVQLYHILMLSYIEGGNMLPAEDFALIGKDSLDLSCIINQITAEQAIKQIAGELHYKAEDICFVEQPDYHLDIMIMHLGQGRVMIKASNQGISTRETIRDLCSFPKIKQVYVSYGEPAEISSLCDSSKLVFLKDDLGGRQTPVTWGWEYNFFNGEYILGKDGKLYYITNDCCLQKAKDNFSTFMKEQVKVQDVIFHPDYCIKTFNLEQGGFGCAHKGIRTD